MLHEMFSLDVYRIDNGMIRIFQTRINEDGGDEGFVDIHPDQIETLVKWMKEENESL